MSSSYGITRLIDGQLRFLQPGGQQDFAALRVKKFADSAPNVPVYSQLGFIFTPTSPNPATTGFTDYRIDPPPVVRLLSVRNLTEANALGVKLLAGARDVLISETFVRAQMTLRNFTDPKQVFEDDTTVGIIVNNKIIVSLDSIMPDYAFGNSVTWTIRGNASELR